MSGLTNRVKRGSRGSATLLEAANRILRLLGVSSTKRGKQPSPKTKVRSMTASRVYVYPLVTVMYTQLTFDVLFRFTVILCF